MSILADLTVTVGLTEKDGMWEVRAEAEDQGIPYMAIHTVPQNVYAFALPTIMSRMVHDVAGQVVAAVVGRTSESRL